MAAAKRGEFNGKIAVVGGHELTTGYRLLGATDTFSPGKEDATTVVNDILSSGKYGFVVIGSEVRNLLPRSLIERLEASTIPLVLFMPELKSGVQDEPLAALAKKILGVDLVSGVKR
ncbi:MAG: V-type ATP synthase subunit F [Thermoprotei archaeon]